MGVECPTCDKELTSERGMRQHHAKVHGINLPNSTCEYCGNEWYDENSDRKRCPDCPDQISPPPEGYEGTDEEWSSLSPYQRWYFQNSDSEIKRSAEQRKSKRKKLREHKEKLECEWCGFDEHYSALDFHHPDEDGDERMSVSYMANHNHSWEKIRREIDTLVVLCSNCHRIAHHHSR